MAENYYYYFVPEEKTNANRDIIIYCKQYCY